MLGGLGPLSKKLIFSALGIEQILDGKIRRLQEVGALTILNFHRVGPDDGSSYPPLSPSLFDEAMAFCAKHFSVVTFSDLENYEPGDKPPVIVSFDDGYQDFCEYAVPIMDRHGVRCNLNVIPGCIEAGLPPLNVLLQDFVGRAPESLLADFDLPNFKIDLREGRDTIGNRVSALVKNKPIAEQKQLAEHVQPQIERFEEFRPTPMMPLDTLREVGKVQELGAHSYEHATLACETDDYVRRDALACKDYFREKLGYVTDIYALPNGSNRPGIKDILRAAGFRHILLTGEDYSRPDSIEHPRFNMYGASRPEIRFRATGFRRD